MTDSTRTVMITGASSASGEGAVRAFADRGYRVWATYGDLAGVPTAMFKGFADMADSGAAPDPKMVIDVYLALADAAPGKRPTRTVAGINWGVDEVNAFTEPRQDALLKAMQLDTVLGGVSP